MEIKRIFDFFISLVGLVMLFPVFLVIIILIKTKTSGPVFFRQSRVGRYGELFTLIKFRTMTQEHGGSTISIKGEKRITPLGSVLRKYKLDELPELWNVLKGDMSFVGPRPDVPGYADTLTGDFRKILELRPGITGPASIKYKEEEVLLAEQEDPIKYNDEVIYPDKVRINLEYFEKRNFWIDLKLIIYTILGKTPKDFFVP